MKSFKFIHLADSHCGRTAYNKFDEFGVNIREKEILGAFLIAIKSIIEARPDFVIFAGDIYDSARPSNRAIDTVEEGFYALDSEGITSIVVAGNHATPKTAATISVISLLRRFKHVAPVYKFPGEYSVLEIPNINVVVHSVCHCFNQDVFNYLMKRVSPVQNKFNIFASHGAFASIDAYKFSKTEQFLDGKINPGFKYAALGHYHKRIKIDCGNECQAWYSGSMVPLSFGEEHAAEWHGGNLISVNEEEEITVEPFKIESRKVIVLPSVNADENIEKSISELPSIPDGSIVQLKIISDSRSKLDSINTNQIENKFKNCFYFEIKRIISSDKNNESVSIKESKSMRDSMIEYFDSINKAESCKIALHYLDMAQNKNEKKCEE